VKAVGGIYWLASALEVRSRLWLGSVISHSRDRHLVRSLLIRVRSCGPVERILLVTDGLSSYLSQALHVFREPVHSGKVGRPRLVLAAGLMIARVIKRHERRRVVEICGATASWRSASFLRLGSPRTQPGSLARGRGTGITSTYSSARP
jgi:hypothetical protein